jgi:hypothetical protein
MKTITSMTGAPKNGEKIRKNGHSLPRITAKIGVTKRATYMKQPTCREKPSMGSWSKYQNLQF